ncbi:MAG: ankyrin repeat domain-containing protein [Pirellulales bacterium]
MLVTISGNVYVLREKGGDEVQEEAELKTLDGWCYQEDVCSNYVHDDLLNDVDLQGGDVRLTWDARRKALRVVTTYRTADKLTAKQLSALRLETMGQWNDGIGAGCFADRLAPLGLKLRFGGNPKLVDAKQADEKRKGGDKPSRITIFGAIKRGSLDGVRKAIAAGEDLATVRQDMTPLTAAVEAGQIEIVRMLLDAGADVRTTTRDRETALHRCAGIRCDQLADKLSASIALLLCERGADPVALDIYGHSPLELTKYTKKKLTAEVLAKAGARIHSPEIAFRDPKGKPAAVRFMYGHASAESWHDGKSDSQGAASLRDLVAGPHVINAVTKGVRIEPAEFVVLESGQAEPATFTCRPE